MTRLHPSLPVLLALLLVACDAGPRPPGRDGGGGGGSDGGGGGMDGAMMSIDSSVPPRDAGFYDPFDPDGGCGATAIPTTRVPGSLLLVFDRSGSMSDTPNGDDPTSSNPSKWDLARGAINSVLGSIPDELSMGLMLFPTGEGDECNVALSAGVPHVRVAPLSTSRPQIMSVLAGADASAGVTPIFDALRAGYDYLDTLDTPGQRGIVLVTDGEENCDLEDKTALYAQVMSERTMSNYLTYAVGLTTSNATLSTIAYNGGTPRNDTCIPQCTTDSCLSDGDCPGAGTCTSPIAGFPGFCGCSADSDCPSPLRCMSIPFFGGQCSGTPNCCHYDASAGSFRSDFEAALDEIARSFLDSCVFDLPRGADPSLFDPTQVNVGVTFDGEMRTVLGRSTDSSVDSWNFVSDEHEAIIIQGAICERLLMGSATVEIVLGCPTILI
ncbi:MAG: VWA domain-containing protein [Sandaracinaceae bacterium]|nr:VWA domain-containing protein [Sandaracinaceae bacterium]